MAVYTVWRVKLAGWLKCEPGYERKFPSLREAQRAVAENPGDEHEVSRRETEDHREDSIWWVHTDGRWERWL